ncbi:hypothetical protein GDO86_015801 [Hymenochirus boettgeri]|uniref:Uncharacterized protein n=1 Tax=Hymenochirus boettgeri TaxID=247094 RepID=A0A8T2JYR8_9PIPI|nr:hypothetical protein GDO86_015801 [Hymenochirus boettgeri]
MDEYRHDSEKFLDDLSRFKDWINRIQMKVFLPDASQVIHREAKLALKKQEVLLKELREKLLDLESLNIKYRRFAQVPFQLFLPNNLCSRMQEVNKLCYQVQKELEDVLQVLKLRVQQREDFNKERDEMRFWLTEMDIGLSSVEYMYSGNSTEKIYRLQKFQDDVKCNMERMDRLFDHWDQLRGKSDPQDVELLETDLEELGSYCDEIFTRFSRFQKRLVSTKLVFEDDSLSDNLEMLSHNSSDVFLETETQDESDQYTSVKLSGDQLLPNMLEVSVGELNIDLEWDPLGDVGRAESKDGQESFHTANSKPWNALNRKRSQSSLNSALRSQGYESKHPADMESHEDFIRSSMAITPSLDNCNLKRKQKKLDIQSENTVPAANIHLSKVPIISLHDTFTSKDCSSSCSDCLDIGVISDECKTMKHFYYERKLVTSKTKTSPNQNISKQNISQSSNCIAQKRRQGHLETSQRLKSPPKSDKYEVSIFVDYR